MLHDYPDIRAITDKEPLWYDAHGVPRYAAHHPDLCPDIYADEVALVEIMCCGECRGTFMVQMSWSQLDSILHDSKRLSEDIGQYGDPPCHGYEDNAICSGSTMIADEMRVVEFWKRDNHEWERVPELERYVRGQ